MDTKETKMNMKWESENDKEEQKEEKESNKQGKCNLDNPVEQHMTELLYVVSTNQTIAECMEMMTQKHIRHLPVVQEEEVIGLISIGDVVKQLIADQESTIDHLEKYITGTGYGR